MATGGLPANVQVCDATAAGQCTNAGIKKKRNNRFFLTRQSLFLCPLKKLLCNFNFQRNI
jgi:hypothetical protein